MTVKKASDKWKICIEYINFNKACPKDSFSFPKIDQLVDITSRHKLLSFMNIFFSYNQIRMAPKDEENMAFIIDKYLYCYKMIFFVWKMHVPLTNA